MMKSGENEMRKRLWTLNNVPVTCEKCGGAMKYHGTGIYKCELCGNEAMDDFGKVKVYLDEHGPTSAITIAKETGVHRDIIDNFLRKGRLYSINGCK